MADFLSAISVFLVFLTFLLNSIEKEVSELLHTRKPESAQSEKLKQYKRDLKRMFYLKSLPIALIYLVSFYVLLPTTIKIIATSYIDLWDFNELETLFVFIEIGLLGLTIYVIIKTFKLFKKIMDLEKSKK